MDLFVLEVVDQVTDGGQMRQLANGWMDWEFKSGRRLRSLGARMLFALAAYLAPTEMRPSGTPQPLTTTPV